MLCCSSRNRFTNGSHQELPAYEMRGPQASKAAAIMKGAARSWWRSVMSEPHSFQKAALFVGLGNQSVSNIMAMYAHERTPGSVTLLERGATGFVHPGDRMCWSVKVSAPGVFSTSQVFLDSELTVSLSVTPMGFPLFAG